jgi:2,3-bisphosphoglycerate-independent phosphoglycerate mutase
MMKHVILVGDGMADYPVEALGGQTPLEVAHTPWMDRMAREGVLGRVRTIPPGFPPGSDIASLVILGYDPAMSYTGRGPLEAASMGISLGSGDVAFRCNLVHLAKKASSTRMKDFTAGHIPTEEAIPIIRALNESLGNDEVSYYAGVSYRHLMIWHNGSDEVQTTPPHDITNLDIEPYLPKGKGGTWLRDLILRSQEFFADVSLRSEIDIHGPNPPNAIWPWGQGRAPAMESLNQRCGIKGAIITAVDLLKGLGIYSGLEVVNVPGATGYYDTDYGAKARYALRVLQEGCDLAFVHVEAPDEAGHQGNLAEKIRSIESFDRELVGHMLEGIQQWPEWSVLVLPDHATPLSVQTHTDEPVPFAILSASGVQRKGEAFNERAARRCGLYLDRGQELFERFLDERWE